MHIAFENSLRTLSEAIEKFSVSVFVQVDANPVSSGFSGGVRVGDDDRRS